MRFSTALKEKYNMSYRKDLLEKWGKNIDAVVEVYPQYADISKINLAICCENTESEIAKANKILSETTQSSDVGPYKRHAFELITAVLPNLCAEEVVSVQALEQKIGQIFFLKYVYGSNKGDIQKGSTMFGPYEMNGNENYTSEFVDKEVISEGGSASVSATLAYGPLIAGTIQIVAGTVVGKDDGEGHITGTGISAGTVNYESGAVAITFASAPSDVVEANYQYSLEYAPTQATEIDMVVDEKIVIARPRRLRTNWSFSAAYDLEKQFGLSYEDEMLEAGLTEIRYEIDHEIFNDLYRQAGLTDSWDMTVPLGVPQDRHYATFNFAFNRGANKIFKATKRAKGNFLITGINGMNVVESLDSFVPKENPDKRGIYVAGTMKDGSKVICDPFYNDDAYLIGYKGKMFIEAGYVYAPYCPVFATNVVMLDDFRGRRGMGTSYAKAMLCPNFYVKGTITHSPAETNVNVNVANTDPIKTTIENTTENPVNTKEVQG